MSASISSGVARVEQLARRVLTREALTSDTAWLISLALASFIAHLLVAGNYGYFRDELYYIDAGRHFQTGYVDFPPFIAWLAGVLRLFGDNLIVLHAVSALAESCLIVVTGLMARELGGGRGAQLLAALGSAVAITFMATGSLFTMDAFDELWWALAAYVFIRLIRRDEPRLWLLFGLIAGIGLFTKLSMLFFGVALVVGLLLTPQRKAFRSRWPWLGGAIAFAFLVPYIAWQIPNGWPTPEFWRNYGGVESGSSPLDFLLSQIFTLNPFTLPLWIAGLVFYFRPQGKPYRALGWAYVVLYALFTLTHAKSYFLAPAYPMLFAAGAVQLVGVFERRQWSLAGPAYAALLVASGLALAPAAMPVLPPAQYGQLYGWIGPLTGAKQQEGQTPLLQILADRFGWPQQAKAVGTVYTALPADERAQACIFTANYGEAGGLNFFGPAYHLPRAISGHNTYYFWGYGACTGQAVIALGFSQQELAQVFGQVTPAATITCANCVDEESRLTIYVCRQSKLPMRELWQRARHFN
jgi:4-amino-4-deoxy-L-arabinose transferase-like glycosyltransferase